MHIVYFGDRLFRTDCFTDIVFHAAERSRKSVVYGIGVSLSMTYVWDFIIYPSLDRLHGGQNVDKSQNSSKFGQSEKQFTSGLTFFRFSFLEILTKMSSY